MIIDFLDNSELYEGLGEKFKKAFEYLKKTDFINTKPGKYEIDGDEIFAIVNEYETKPKEDAELESHVRYADVQYIAEGVEQIGWAPLVTQEVSKPYSEENDVMFVTGDANFNWMDQGMFAVFFPKDLHMPGVNDQTSYVKKVVVKVKIV